MRQGEAELVAGLKRMDPASWEEAVSTYGQRLKAVANRYLRDPIDAEDAVQRTWLNVFKYVGEFKGDSKLSSWLHRIVSNQAMMMIRKRKRSPKIVGPIDEEISFASADLQPERRVESEEQLERILKSAALAGEEEALVVRLSAGGFSRKEISESISISVASMKSRLRRARISVGMEFGRTLSRRPRARPGPRRPDCHPESTARFVASVGEVGVTSMSEAVGISKQCASMRLKAAVARGLIERKSRGVYVARAG